LHTMYSTLAFLHLVFVGFIALFPPVNPIGTALIVNPLLQDLNPQERKTASRKIATYCFLICSTAVIAGSWIFKLFSISIPVVQLAGGIMICKMGWDFLSSNNSGQLKESVDIKEHHEDVGSILFYPLAFPLTTGAGTISVLLTLSAHGHDENLSKHLVNLAALGVSIILMTILIYVSFAFTPLLIKRLGNQGEQIVNRLSAFLVFCVGIQIASTGLIHLFKL